MSLHPTPPRPRKGRVPLLEKPTTTTISLEETLLTRVRTHAAGLRKSASEWWREAATEKLEREERQKRRPRK